MLIHRSIAEIWLLGGRIALIVLFTHQKARGLSFLCKHLPGKAQHPLLMVDTLCCLKGAMTSIEPEDFNRLTQFSGALLIDLDGARRTTRVIVALNDEQRGTNPVKISRA